VVSTGNGDTAGLNKITGDITKMAAQVPALFEALSGMPLADLFANVRKIGEKTPGDKTPGDKTPKPDSGAKAPDSK
jgi:flotillin